MSLNIVEKEYLNGEPRRAAIFAKEIAKLHRKKHQKSKEREN
jgi:hypothetical protein